MPKTKKSKLEFMPAGPNEGFRSGSMSAYDNTDAATIIRELIQNSLDAAKKAKRKTVEVVFQLDTMATNEIPAIADYKNAFKSACATQTKLGNLVGAKNIVADMENAIAAKASPILWVRDNGVGLDSKRMQKLLSDGDSDKDDADSTGAYGNGHLTAFPASNLRYVLYGGVFGDNSKIAAGHAILASHQEEGKNGHGKDGYLVEDIRGDLFERYKFYENDAVPKILAQQLDRIHEDFGTGAVVGIPAFNYFRENTARVVNTIQLVAAMHFTPAIHKNQMKITIEHAGEVHHVKQNSLATILEQKKSRERRDRNSIGPSGKRVWEAFETLKEKPLVCPTSSGKVHVHFREATRGSTHLQLYRNGMWITDHIPQNQPSHFGNTAAFNALILLDPALPGAKDICSLVRSTEGPKHIDIEPKRLKHANTKKAYNALMKALGEVHDFIKELAPELKDTMHDPGFLILDVPGVATAGGSSPNQPGTNPVPVPAPAPQVLPHGPRKPKPEPPIPPDPLKPSYKRSGKRVEIPWTAARTKGAVRIAMKSPPPRGETSSLNFA